MSLFSGAVWSRGIIYWCGMVFWEFNKLSYDSHRFYEEAQILFTESACYQCADVAVRIGFSSQSIFVYDPSHFIVLYRWHYVSDLFFNRNRVISDEDGECECLHVGIHQGQISA